MSIHFEELIKKFFKKDINQLFTKESFDDILDVKKATYVDARGTTATRIITTDKDGREVVRYFVNDKEVTNLPKNIELQLLDEPIDKDTYIKQQTSIGDSVKTLLCSADPDILYSIALTKQYELKIQLLLKTPKQAEDTEINFQNGVLRISVPFEGYSVADDDVVYLVKNFEIDSEPTTKQLCVNIDVGFFNIEKLTYTTNSELLTITIPARFSNTPETLTFKKKSSD